jgi:hypothetical protein
MGTAGVATAQSSSRTLIGPLSTQSGFQYWYLVCFPDTVIAVRQSIAAFFAFGLSNGAVPPIFGLLGALINILVSSRTKGFRERNEAALQSAPVALLRAKTNIVYPVAQLKSISFKNVARGGNLILPDIILETRRGAKQKYGMQRSDFDKACAQLKQLYPSLCQ